MKTKIENKIIFYFLCIASSLADNGSGTPQPSETTKRVITAEFDKKQNSGPDDIMIYVHEIKNGGMLIFFVKKSFQNLKFAEDELNFTEKLTFGVYVTRKWSDYFKPKHEIPQQFEIICMKLNKN